MPRCQFVSNEGILCLKKTFFNLAYCWKHLSVWIKSFGVLGIVGLLINIIIGLVGFISDLRGIGIPIPAVVQNEEILVPGSDPTPSHHCLSKIPKDVIKIFVGNNLAYQTDLPIQIIEKTGKDLLFIKKDDNGFLISAKTYDKNGYIIAEIDNNKFHLNYNKLFHIKRPNKHTLAVYDQRAEKVLDIGFINSNTIKILGIFNIENGEPIIIDEGGVKTYTFTYLIYVLGNLALVYSDFK